MTGTYHGEFEYNGFDIEYTVNVSADYYYDPGRMYMPNGDPGYPPESSIDNFKVEDVDEIHVWKGEEQIENFDYKEIETLCLKDADENADESNSYWEE